MSEGSPPDAPLTPAEERARALLAELRASQPAGGQLAASVTRALRWQRPLRRALEAVGVTSGGILGGLASAVRGTRRR
jgi:hypothetical protein